MFIGVGVDGTLCSSPLPLQIAFGEAGAEIIGKNLVCALGGREANVATFKNACRSHTRQASKAMQYAAR